MNIYLFCRHTAREARPASTNYTLNCYTQEQPNIQAKLSGMTADAAESSKEDEVRDLLQRYCALMEDFGSIEPVHDDLMAELDTLCAGK